MYCINLFIYSQCLQVTDKLPPGSSNKLSFSKPGPTYAQKNNQFQTRASPSDGHSGVKVNKVSGLGLVSDGRWVCAKDSFYWWSSVKIQLNPGWLGIFLTWFFQALPARVCLKGNINSNNSNFNGSCSHLLMKGFWLNFFSRMFSKGTLFKNIKSALFLMQFFLYPVGKRQNRNMNDWHHIHSSPLITKIQFLTQAHPVCLLLPSGLKPSQMPPQSSLRKRYLVCSSTRTVRHARLPLMNPT